MPPFPLLLALAAGAAPLVQEGAGEAAEVHELAGYLSTLAPLDTPSAAAFDRRGRLYVAETGADRIRVFDPSGADFATWGARGAGAGELAGPRGIAVAPSGEVFVADTGNSRVQVFGANGAFARQWGLWGSEAGRLHTPVGVACTDERVAVADVGRRSVEVFDVAGAHLFTIGGALEGAESAMGLPVDVAFDERSRLYVVDADRHRILVFDAKGELERAFGDFGSFPGLFSDPRSIAFHADELFVADRENHRVQVFSPAGEMLERFGTHTIRPREGKGTLHYPTHLAVAPAGDRLAICEPSDDRVQIFGRGGTLDAYAAALRESAGAPSPHFGHEVTAAGHHMVLTEPETRTLLVYDLQWQEPRKIGVVGGYGRGLGLFGRPAGLDLAGDLSLLVCDPANQLLQLVELQIDLEAEVVFDPKMARFVRALDLARLGRRVGGDELAWTIEPTAVARDESGNVYLLDARNERVFLFAPDWRPLTSFGGHGTQPGRLRAPTALEVSPKVGLVYVVDGGNRRVQAFDRSGEFAFELGAGPEGGGALREPFGLAVDAEGAVYVSDAGGHRIVKYDARGAFLAAWGKRGLGRDELCKPRGLAFDGAGRLVVVDHGNHRGFLQSASGEFLQAFGSRIYTRPARLPDTYDPSEYEDYAYYLPWSVDEGPGTTSNGGLYYVAYLLPGGEVPLNEEFSIELRIVDAASRSSVVEGAEVAVDARMPDHGHGMKQSARVVRREDGSFLVEGLLFHMPGYWEVYVDVSRGAVTERAQFGIELE